MPINSKPLSLRYRPRRRWKNSLSKDGPPAENSHQKEWDACLQMVEKYEDRLDGVRKYGFTVITGLLSADAVIGQVKDTTISLPVKGAAIFSTIILIFALRVLDKDYQAYQKVASDRARSIEGELNFRLQRDIAYTYRARRMWRNITSLYYLFFLSSISLGVIVLSAEPAYALTVLVLLLPGLVYIWRTEPRTRFFAYGSDMDVEQMARRLSGSGPDSKQENAKLRELKKHRVRGILRGYELKFNKVNDKVPGAGYANIVSYESGFVEGALYNISESDLWEMDRYEGYPKHYDREPVNVETDKGRLVEAQVYIANREKTSTGLKPTKAYLNHLKAGEDVLKLTFKRFENEPTID
jgi:gamma-glutamylcyclotransferase